jgi:hypothetical protein
VTKLCKNFLKGKCNKGDACTYHHNGPCHFHAKGSCKHGDSCVFSHHETVKPAVVAPVASEVSAKNGRKKKDEDA